MCAYVGVGIACAERCWFDCCFTQVYRMALRYDLAVPGGGDCASSGAAGALSGAAGASSGAAGVCALVRGLCDVVAGFVVVVEDNAEDPVMSSLGATFSAQAVGKVHVCRQTYGWGQACV